MKTKLSILLLAGFFLLTTNAYSEIKTIYVTREKIEKEIEIKDGEFGEVVFASILRPDERNNNYAKIAADIYVEIDSVKMQIYIPVLLTDGGFSISKGFAFPVIAGPAKLILKHNAIYKENAFISVKKSPNETAASKAAGPALVLPEGEDGKQKLVLESSTDLVNWMEDSLGSKDSSDKKRFYRLRAVKE